MSRYPGDKTPLTAVEHCVFLTAFKRCVLQGAGKLLRDSRKHPAQLRSEVCTPGGTTIYGLHTLEQGGVRAATMSAVESATERARQLGLKSGGRSSKWRQGLCWCDHRLLPDQWGFTWNLRRSIIKAGDGNTWNPGRKKSLLNVFFSNTSQHLWTSFLPDNKMNACCVAFVAPADFMDEIYISCLWSMGYIVSVIRSISRWFANLQNMDFFFLSLKKDPMD